MLKKYLINLLIIIFFISASTKVFASTPNIYIEDAQKNNNDENVLMNVCVENISSNIASLSFDIKYDESKLQYVSSKVGKNLKTTVKIAEYTDEKDRISINLTSSSGLKTNGTYYQMVFTVLDTSTNEIPVKLELKTATDVSGNPVSCTSKGGVVKTKATGGSGSSGGTPGSDTGHVVDPFEEEDPSPSKPLDDIVKPNIKPSTTGKIEYEVKDENVINISEDGKLEAKEDGITEIKVLLDGEEIGKIEAEVKDGEVKKISSVDEVKEENDEDKKIVVNDKKKKKSVTESSKNINPIMILFIIIIIVVILIFMRKKKGKDQKRKRRIKNEKID